MGAEAGKNKHFTDLLQCMVENKCFDRYEESGSCLATDDQALDFADYDKVGRSAGKDCPVVPRLLVTGGLCGVRAVVRRTIMVPGQELMTGILALMPGSYRWMVISG